MDELDKKILYYLLRNGRISQNKLAELLGLSVPSLNSRFKRLIEESIIKGFKLFVNPNIFGKYFSYMAFSNLKQTDANYIFVKFRCLENFDVYGVEAKNILELEDYMQSLISKLGNPVMVYYPQQKPMEISKFDQKIFQVLYENPRATVSELASMLELKASKIKKVLENYRGKFAVIPEIDLVKADILLMGIFTKSIDQIKSLTLDRSVITIKGNEGGVEICFVDNIGKAKDIVENVRKIDPNSQIMMVYDYSINQYLNFH